MVYKTCKDCNAPLGDIHGNTLYCERCRIKRRRESRRKSEQRRRDRIKPRVVSDKHGQNVHALTTEIQKQTALELYQQEILEEQFIRMVQRAVSPFLLEVNNRIHRLDVKVDELGQALPLSPQLSKQHPWRERAIQRAIALVLACDGSLPLHRIRQILEDVLITDKRTAELILKKALERIRRGKDQHQKILDDYDKFDLEGFT